MSDADWIDRAADEIAQHSYTIADMVMYATIHKAVAGFIRHHYTAHLAIEQHRRGESLTTEQWLSRLDPDKLAERIVEQAENCIECCYGTYEGFRSEELKSFVNELISPILARNAEMEAVLGKVDGRVRHFAGCAGQYGPYCGNCDCGAREIQISIDALTAKGAGQ